MEKKNIVLLFLMVSAFLLSTSMAGRRPKVINMAEEMNEGFEDGDEASAVHERVLRANTRDYGKYDPAPALVKPPFKLIPN
ncbi:protein CASPARIAN STRIP INTEGRITY FACTOR 1-like [Hibiscus syriacus]|uniref:protein CASPARIAN STRIP INTEGRITY FACTOR 1-like n=1 Tax=Hibiscus syriacus TaxID=106335 RepID=UPI001921AFAF|nr:protein CASPARIAN STRIP INTEGRITY FACTOR 1-like [Hibiscus syriacus]